LYPLRRREPLHRLGAGDGALALGGRHRIELGKTLVHALLDVGLKLPEAGFGLEGVLLLIQG
jgi:hypothetical protein